MHCSPSHLPSNRVRSSRVEDASGVTRVACGLQGLRGSPHTTPHRLTRSAHAAGQGRRRPRQGRSRSSVETINVPDPGPGEAVVKVQACGVCHTDLHYREGGINDDFPFLLGHEAAGIVESVGEGVTDVEPGDFVVLNWRAVCGNCRACNRGEPWYCFATHNATQKMTLEDGTELSPALGIGAFAEKTLVAAGQCTKVDPARPARRGRPARLRRDGRPRRRDQHRQRRPRQVASR